MLYDVILKTLGTREKPIVKLDDLLNRTRVCTIAEYGGTYRREGYHLVNCDKSATIRKVVKLTMSQYPAGTLDLVVNTMWVTCGDKKKLLIKQKNFWYVLPSDIAQKVQSLV